MKEAKNLTREEIIKALKQCADEDVDCKGCPLYISQFGIERPTGYCFNALKLRAAELLEKASYE